jgi:putative transposase
VAMTGDQQWEYTPGVPTGPEPPSARQAINEMLDAGLLDPVMEQVDREGLRLTGSGGFLPELVKAVLERGLTTELTEHLGYEKGDPAGRGSPNSRNGSTPKTVASEVGDVRLDVPRDRMGSFEPRLVPKGSRRAGGLDEMIISLYAGGMTVRDIGRRVCRKGPQPACGPHLSSPNKTSRQGPHSDRTATTERATNWQLSSPAWW